MKILVIGKGKMGNLIYEFLNKNTKFLIDQVSFDKEFKKDTIYDYIIDFSHPESLKEYRRFLGDNTKIIIGTTGFCEKDEEYILFLSKLNPVVKDSNFSKGICLLRRLLEEKELLKNYKIFLDETHHNSKLDMVSGTLRSFLDILDNLELKYDYKTNRVEDKCYGKHNIVLKNKVEEIVISHTVLDRGLFLEGILQSMDYISNKKSGLFTYEDIIYGLS